MKKILTIVVLLVLVVVAFVGIKFLNQPKQIACTQEAKICPDGSSVGRTGPNCDFAECPIKNSNDYKSISYEIEGQTVKLKDGISEIEIVPSSASKTITQYFGNEVRADFNGDGTEDVAFLLTQDRGGSGTFYYVVVALNLKDGYAGTNAIFLGDRIAPQTTEFRNGEIIVNYADRKPGESMAVAPSVGVSKYFKISDGKLIEVKNRF